MRAPLRESGRTIGAPVGHETDLLPRVTVRLLHEHERPAFDRLLEEKHYLHEARQPHRVHHRLRFVLACAAVATLMGACGYRAFENTCQKFTQRQLRALGCRLDEDTGRYHILRATAPFNACSSAATGRPSSTARITGAT